MASVKTLTHAFTGGEIAPELYGRLDVEKRKIGLALCKNFIVLAHGPIARRPGLSWCGPCLRDQADTTFPVGRLIPFQLPGNEGAVLEFGHLYLRFFYKGAPVLEAAKAVTGVTNGPDPIIGVTAHGWSVGNWVYLAGLPGLPRLHARFAEIKATTANSITLQKTDGTQLDTTGQPEWVSGGTVARVFRLGTPYTAADLADIGYAQQEATMTLTHPNISARELKYTGPGTWTLSALSFAPTIAAPTGVAATPTVAQANFLTVASYAVSALANDGVTESALSSVVTANNNLALAGNFNTITWTAVTGALRYFVYKNLGGELAFVGQANGTSFQDNNILPDSLKRPPEQFSTINAGTGNLASVSAYHEQRRWFGGTLNSPLSIAATRPGAYTNMTASIPTRDDDAFEFKLASSTLDTIRHMIPLADLLVFTTSGEWRVYADSGAVTPSNIAIKPQSFIGAAKARPVAASNAVLFVRAKSARLMEIKYAWEANAFNTIDVSLLAPHLFNFYTINDIVLGVDGEQVAWLSRSDGKVLGMTYVPEQQVYAWHQHETVGGFVESLCAVPEDDGVVVYGLVRRTINGRKVRYVERMRSRYFADQKDAFHVDCGATYDGSPTTTVSGLHHLEGVTVDILADGAEHPQRVVTDSKITLDSPASVVHVGIPMVSDAQLLPAVDDGEPAGFQGTFKNVNRIRARVASSVGLAAGPSFDKLREYPLRDVSTPYDTAPPLRTGEVKLELTPTWGADGSVVFRRAGPLPLTLVSVTLEMEGGG
jgi:hypothetical protein